MINNVISFEAVTSRRTFIKGSVTGIICIAFDNSNSLAQAKVTPEDFETPSGVKMSRIPGGEFIMGDKDGDVDETPHKVFVDPFYIDKFL